MKMNIKQLVGCLVSFASFSLVAQNNVGIGTNTPDPSSVLELNSTGQGMLVPRMTTIQRTAIAAPAEALLVYDTDFDCFYFFKALTGWQDMCSGTGTAGPQGPAGPQGSAGATGPQGPAGVQGTPGLVGATGAQGPQGAIGLTGPQGPAGVNGINGTNGTNGVDGLPGATGPQGPIGLTGPQGPAGVDGLNGTNGTNGVDGLPGATGPAGVDGLNGTNGTNGVDGLPGAIGPQGPIGLTGPQGPAGANGVNGTNGVDGLPGATGPQGPQGPAGPSWTLTTPNFNADGTVVVNGTAGSGGPVTSASGAWLTAGNTAAVANYIGTNNAVDFRMYSSGLERMTIEANGNIGIRTAAPTRFLHMINPAAVGANSMASFENTGADGVSISAYNQGVGNAYNAVEGITNFSGNGFIPAGVFGLAINGTLTHRGIGVRGTANGRDGIGVYGSRQNTGGIIGWGGVFYNDLGYTGFFGAASDEKTKTIIKNISSALSIVSKLRPVTYNFNFDKYPNMGLNTEMEYGFIAQEVKAVLPEIVRTKKLDVNACEEKQVNSTNESSDEEFVMMDYTRIIPILTKAIQEQQTMIEKLEERIKELESK